jgi:hypothetical protein
MYVLVQPSTPSTEVFRESFDSWDSLDANWTVWNSTNPPYNYITIDNGTLMMSDYGTQLVDDSLQAMALWKSLVTYSNTLTVSFLLYLPMNHDEKYGYYGQSVYFSLLSPSQAQNLSAVPGINTRFLMDTWTGAPNGWSFANANGSLQKICDFEAGWHSVSVTMRKGLSYWDATFDGVVYSGLTYSSSWMTGYDLGAVRIDNGLREEVAVSRVDDLVIKVGGITSPPQASFSAQVVGATVWVDATTSKAAAGIAKYTWNWGDGSPTETYPGPYASHTYSASAVMSNAITQQSAINDVARGPPPTPYNVFGYVTSGPMNGIPVVGISVLVANVRTGDMMNTTTDVYGFYTVDLSLMPNYFMDGDVIQVTATDGLVYGSDYGVVNTSMPYTWIDIVVWPMGQVVYYTITLTVTDTLGQTDSETMQVGVRIQ